MHVKRNIHSVSPSNYIMLRGIFQNFEMFVSLKNFVWVFYRTYTQNISIIHNFNASFIAGTSKERLLQYIVLLKKRTGILHQFTIIEERKSPENFTSNKILNI